LTAAVQQAAPWVPWVQHSFKTQAHSYAIISFQYCGAWRRLPDGSCAGTRTGLMLKPDAWSCAGTRTVSSSTAPAWRLSAASAWPSLVRLILRCVRGGVCNAFPLTTSNELAAGVVHRLRLSANWPKGSKACCIWLCRPQRRGEEHAVAADHGAGAAHQRPRGAGRPQHRAQLL
jgi:hypothetical protein